MTRTSQPEQEVWSEHAAMRDVLINPLILIPVLVVGYFTYGMSLLVYLPILLHRYYKRYRLTTQRIIVTQGILQKHVDEVELYRVKDTRCHQNLLERIVNMGNITVNSTDETGSFVIEKVVDPTAKREEIRRLTEEAKNLRNVRVLE